MRLRNYFLTALVLLVAAGALNAQQLPERYTRYSQAVQILDSLETTFPTICRLDTMGYSSRDSVPMLRFKISDNADVDEDEPAVFFCGGVHADEVLGVEVVISFIKTFLTRYAANDSATLFYANNLEIFCIPFINPEGHIVVENGDTDWRKNKYDNDHNGVFNYHDGVDNNRNYDFGWSLDTAPDAIVPESLQYKGTAAFTQNENIAMRDFAWRYRPMVAIDYHSPTYGRAEKAYYNWYWYGPEGHGMSPDEDLMHTICNQFCSRILRDARDSCYEARRGLVDKGDFKTYFYGNFGTVSFSVEISDTTIQNPALVDSICAHHLPGQYFLMSRVFGPGITGIIRDSLTLEPIEAEVQVSQAINADIHARLSRPDFGRYRRVLNPGTYTLVFKKTGYRTKTVSNVIVHSAGGPTVVDYLLPQTNPRPPAPVTYYPPNDTLILDSLPVFRWHRTVYATKYDFEIYSDSALTSLLFIDSTLTDSSITPGFVPTDSTFYWRVRAGNTGGWGAYSTVSRFYMEIHPETPGTPIAIYPPSDTTINDSLPSFIWHLSSFTTKYLFELYSDSSLGHIVYIDSTVTDTSLAPSLVTTDSFFYWRLKGGNSYLWGDYSTVSSFHLLRLPDAIGDDKTLPRNISLGQNYPNPFNIQTMIALNVPAGKIGQLQIFDIGGRRIQEFAGLAGQERIVWNGRDRNGHEVKSGIYFYRLIVGEKSFTEKMILLK
ncbi:MAG TPA: hypothetical protein DEO84_02630 [candidate division Zixibacteria bacterium]|nr:hypothetical protein [candidate division Zixibacteria bacterium]